MGVFLEALNFAAQAHGEAVRKGNRTPAILHAAEAAAILAKHLRKVHKNRVSFDMVVETMNKTGKKLPIELKESALGGLASVIKI